MAFPNAAYAGGNSRAVGSSISVPIVAEVRCSLAALPARARSKPAGGTVSAAASRLAAGSRFGSSARCFGSGSVSLRHPTTRQRPWDRVHTWPGTSGATHAVEDGASNGISRTLAVCLKWPGPEAIFRSSNVRPVSPPPAGTRCMSPTAQTGIVFLSGARTGFGTFGGTLKDLSATDLGAIAPRRRAGAWRRGGRADRSRRLRQRPPDLGRRHLPRPPRRPSRRPADRDSGRNGEPALRVRLRSCSPGSAADPARRIATWSWPAAPSR